MFFGFINSLLPEFTLNSAYPTLKCAGPPPRQNLKQGR